MSGRMSLNISLNMLGTVVTALAGLLTLPFLIRQLGVENYGLWTLVAGTTGFLSTLDLGVAGSLGRLVAGRRASDDIAGINAYMSTALVLMVVTGLLLIPVGVIGAHVFVVTFHVHQERISDAQITFLIVAFTVAISFPTAIFSSLIWGYERFDIENSIDLPVLIGRACLIFVLLRPTTPLAELALITGCATLLGTVANAFACWRIEPRLRLGWRYVRLSAVREIYAFGFWYWLLGMSRSLTTQVGPFFIGATLGNAAVTQFAIARQLVFYTNAMVMAASRTAAPRAAVLHFGQQRGYQEALFIEGGQYSFALSLFLAGGMISLGSSFLDLWQGERGSGVYVLLVILILGELVPMSQWVTAAILSSVGSNALLVVLAVGEGLLSVALALLTFGTFGLVGVCVGIAGSAFLFKGLLQMYLGCRVVGITIASYLMKVYAKVAFMAALPMTFGIAINYVVHPNKILQFVMVATIYGVFQSILIVQLLFKDAIDRLCGRIMGSDGKSGDHQSVLPCNGGVRKGPTVSAEGP